MKDTCSLIRCEKLVVHLFLMYMLSFHLICSFFSMFQFCKVFLMIFIENIHCSSFCLIHEFRLYFAKASFDAPLHIFVLVFVCQILFFFHQKRKVSDFLYDFIGFTLDLLIELETSVLHLTQMLIKLFLEVLSWLLDQVMMILDSNLRRPLRHTHPSLQSSFKSLLWFQR